MQNGLGKRGSVLSTSGSQYFVRVICHSCECRLDFNNILTRVVSKLDTPGPEEQVALVFRACRTGFHGM